jgi:hypothetical protein
MKRVIRSDKPVTSVFPVQSQKCDYGAEPRCRFLATSAGKGLTVTVTFQSDTMFFLAIKCFKVNFFFQKESPYSLCIETENFGFLSFKFQTIVFVRDQKLSP